MRTWLTLGAAYLAVAVAAGAFGAHGLRARLDARSLELWETAVRYLVIAGFALAVVGLAAGRVGGGRWRLPGCLLAAGAPVFSGTVAALALGAPRMLGAITPIGGLLLIAGLIALAVSAWRG